MNEAARVRAAVAESLEIGTLSPALIDLIYAMCKKRVGRHDLAEDIAQDVLVGLLRNLLRIDLEADVVAYVGTAIVKTWRHKLRGRRIERRYLIFAMNELLDDLPPAVRAPARACARASFARVQRLKFY